jgi:hypothetical protein
MARYDGFMARPGLVSISISASHPNIPMSNQPVGGINKGIEETIRNGFAERRKFICASALYTMSSVPEWRGH